MEKEIKKKAGDVIFSVGDPSSALFIIREGQIGIYKTAGSDKPVPVGLLKSGEFLGEMSLLNGKPHTAKAIALTDVQLVAIPKEKVMAVLKETPSWVSKLLMSSISRLQKTNDILKRNNLIDEDLNEDIHNIQENFKKNSCS